MRRMMLGSLGIAAALAAVSRLSAAPDAYDERPIVKEPKKPTGNREKARRLRHMEKMAAKKAARKVTP